MMPELTEKPWPSGLPMASTQSPTLAASLLPKVTKGSALSLSTLRSAMSVRGSRPISLAVSSPPSKSSTRISSAPSMTWVLVTM